MFHNKVDCQGEYDNWRDRGCDLHPSCLNCPEPVCIYDLPRGKQTRRLSLRQKSIRTLAANGMPNGRLAQLFKCSVRTIQRALK